jgi:hypothetical protein
LKCVTWTKKNSTLSDSMSRRVIINLITPYLSATQRIQVRYALDNECSPFIKLSEAWKDCGHLCKNCAIWNELNKVKKQSNPIICIYRFFLGRINAILSHNMGIHVMCTTAITFGFLWLVFKNLVYPQPYRPYIFRTWLSTLFSSYISIYQVVFTNYDDCRIKLYLIQNY